MLNHRKPEHPPDIYYIRRNPKLLDKYLNKNEMDSLMKEVKRCSKSLVEERIE